MASRCRRGTSGAFLARCGPYRALVVQSGTTTKRYYYGDTGELVGDDTVGDTAEKLTCSSYDRSFIYPQATCVPLEGICAGDGGAQTGHGSVCDDGGTRGIRATVYDQECKTDADCVAVADGDACYPCLMACPNAAIRATDRVRYQADVARTLPAGAPPPDACGCGKGEGAPCCIGGKCEIGRACRVEAAR